MRSRVRSIRRLITILAGVLVFAAFIGTAAYGIDGEATGKLNINTATQQELAWFLWRNGLGNAVELSENIVSYRQLNGPFNDIRGLREVRGITAYEFDRIKLWVKLAGESDYRPGREPPAPRYPYPGAPVPRDDYPHNRYPDDEPYGPWRIRP